MTVMILVCPACNSLLMAFRLQGRKEEGSRSIQQDVFMVNHLDVRRSVTMNVSPVDTKRVYKILTSQAIYVLLPLSGVCAMRPPSLSLSLSLSLSRDAKV
jgi:hypothetical protein